MFARKIQLIFLGLAGLITLYFGGRFGWDLKNYLILSLEAPARVSQWELEEKGELWALRAVYSIQVGDRDFSGVTCFQKELYRNEESAFLALKEMAKQSWKGWYRPKDPFCSTLEREFPLMILIRFLTAGAVFLYVAVFQRNYLNR